MLKKILVIATMLYATAAFAAVDVNKATAAELDGIKGIGPGISTKILDERKNGNFKDWNDFIERVKGIGEANAAKFSAEGVTVGGVSYKGVSAAKASEVAKPATPATPAAKAAPKADAKMKAEEEAKVKKKVEPAAKADATKPAASAAKK
ncbi:MAG: hypothetical protein RL211_1284 [Pseudomonadota bacterium]|jgi:competence protein ComEA